MKYLFLFLALMFLGRAFAQPAPYCGQPSVITYADALNCNSTCATLHAAVTGQTPTPAGITNDDVYSAVVPIGFNFTFYGNTYSKCVIGSNGMINFDTLFAGNYNAWQHTQPLLGDVNAVNSVCGPWFDMDIRIAGGTISYATSGTAPNRRFTATWCTVPLYNASYCPNLDGTTQIILYEGCNYIDVHVNNKPLCTAWDSGFAIIGVQNAAGTNAVTAPGKDYPNTYTCTNVAWRFIPSGSTYTVSSIAHHPVPNNGATVKWFQGATQVGTGNTLSCVTIGQQYRAEVTGCNSNVISSSNITPTVTPVNSSQTVNVCVGATAPYTLTLPPGGSWSPGNPAIATINTTAGTVTGISVGTTSFTYTSTYCTHTVNVNVQLCCNDTCSWITTGNNIVYGNNLFGTKSNDDIRIISNNINRAVVKAGGNIGIKQLAPTTTFDVDCVPMTAPSGLRFENLPPGFGRALVVDPLGYVYLSSTSLKQNNNDEDYSEQIETLKQEIDALRLQISLLDCSPANCGHALSITPNPNNGHMTASYKIESGFESAALKVMDSEGKIIKTIAVQEKTGSTTINLPAPVTSGNIIVALVVDGKLLASQKVILIR